MLLENIPSAEEEIPTNPEVGYLCPQEPPLNTILS
jgi:hypothetical protein